MSILASFFKNKQGENMYYNLSNLGSWNVPQVCPPWRRMTTRWGEVSKDRCLPLTPPTYHLKASVSSRSFISFSVQISIVSASLSFTITFIDWFVLILIVTLEIILCITLNLKINLKKCQLKISFLFPKIGNFMQMFLTKILSLTFFSCDFDFYSIVN